jgi:hypothetical protein
MPENKVQITIEAFNNFEKAFREVRSQVSRVRDDTKDLDGWLTRATSSAGGLVKAIAGLWVAKQIFDAITSSIKESLSYMGRMETSALGIAASFLTQGKYIDETTDKVLEGQEALRAAQEEARKVFSELQIANFETIATLDQLVRVYQETLPVAMAKGFNKEQVKEYTLVVVQAAGALGVQLDMLGEETRSMLTAAIVPRTSRIAMALGITNEQVNAAMGDANTLFDFLMGKLEGFRVAGVASQTTWNGLWSNMKDTGLMVGSQVFQPLFNTIKTSLIDIQKKIMEVDETTGKVKGFNPEFLENIKTARTTLGYIVADLIGVVATFDIVGTKIGEQTAKIVERIKHPVKTIKAVFGNGEEGFPEGALDDKIAYYSELINRALGKTQEAETTATTSPSYKANQPSPDADKAKKMAKLTATWQKTSRDLATDLNQVNTNEFDSKIAEYENKALDLKEKFKDVKGAAGIIDQWLSGMKGEELSKYEKQAKEESLKATTEAAKEKYAVVEASEQFITERTKTALEKRIDEEEKASQTLIGKHAGLLAAYIISEEEYDENVTTIREASKRKQIEITQEYNRKILEAETSHQLAVLTVAEKDMTMSKEDVTRGRIAAHTELLAAYNEELQLAIENRDNIARMGWQEKIDQENSSLTEQKEILRELTGTFNEGLIQGIKESAYEMQTSFQYGKQSFEDLASSMKSSFKSAFSDVMSGDAKSFLEYIQDFCDKIIDKWADMLAEMLTNWILTGNMMKNSGSSGSLGGLAGLIAELFSSGSYDTSQTGVNYMGGSWGWETNFARGGIFNAPSLKPYLNTVVNRPTIFKFAYGGVMGEAGPEAIMPLVRTPSGSLGVRAVGGESEQGNVTVVNNYISAMDAPSFDEFCKRRG